MAISTMRSAAPWAGPGAQPGQISPGPLLWQRTDTIGTELVFRSGAEPRTATGSAVIAGTTPHTTQWLAELDTGPAVRALTISCRGGDWSRTLRLARAADGTWSCATEETGDLGMPAGAADPDRLNPAAIVRLSDSPIFLTWALRRLRLTPGGEPVAAPTVRVLCPSLAVLPGISTYQLVSEHRLRIGGDEPTASYDIDHTGIVTYRAGRLRLAR